MTPFSGFKLFLWASIPPAPLVVQTPHFHQISCWTTCWSEGGSDSGNLKRYFASLAAAALAPQARSNGQVVPGPSQSSMNHLPRGCGQSPCDNVDDSEQGATSSDSSFSFGCHGTALKANIQERHMLSEDIPWAWLCAKVSIGPSHETLTIFLQRRDRSRPGSATSQHDWPTHNCLYCL